MNFLENSRIWNAKPQTNIWNNLYLNGVNPIHEEESDFTTVLTRSRSEQKIWEVFVGGLPKGMTQ